MPPITVVVRFRVQSDTVDADTTERYIQEFVMSKFSFIDAAEPMKTDGDGKLYGVSERCLTRADRPIRPQDGEAK